MPEHTAPRVLTEGDTSSSTLRFHPVALTRAHEEVVDQIIYAIRSGLLGVGDRLPTIEELADLTEVSKPVVGDAVKLLREHGILETKRGVQGGVTVINDEIPTKLMLIASGWRKATLTELVEARRPIELELALLAGERATQENFDAMRDALRQLKEAGADERKGAFLRYDHLFHYQIGIAAQSEKLAYLQHRVLSEIAAKLYEYELFHEDISLVLTTHEEILRALETRNPETIHGALDKHWRTSDGAFASLEAIGPTDG